MFPSLGRLFSTGIAVAILGAFVCVGSVMAQDTKESKTATPAAKPAEKPAEKSAETTKADGDAADPAEPPSLSGMLVPVIGMALIFYFIVLAPQKKARKKQDALVESLKKHDRVVTIGGIVGTIVSIDADNQEVMLEVAPDTQVRMLRRSIQGPKPFGNDDDTESTNK
ncbi:MAG: preprotein translocase subunit YajC [Planctomycetota bacterium]|nr:preprotein translocase subunit YajC [Planctomycetota bacterium]